MENRAGRAHSPIQPSQQGYQLEDGPYTGGGRPMADGRQPQYNLEIPMGPGRLGTPSDRLQAQPTVSWQNVVLREQVNPYCLVLRGEYQ